MESDHMSGQPETWRERQIMRWAMQGLTRLEIVEKGFAKSVVHDTLRGWAMNARARKLRKDAWGTMAGGF